MKLSKKIKEQIGTMDFKSLGLFIVFCIVALFLFYFFTNIRQETWNKNNLKYKGEVSGQIISIEPVERMSQSKWRGTEIHLDSYRVTYEYQVEGQKFTSTDLVPISITNKSLIKNLLDFKTKNEFLVKYNLEEPKESNILEKK